MSMVMFQFCFCTIRVGVGFHVDKPSSACQSKFTVCFDAFNCNGILHTIFVSKKETKGIKNKK